MLLIQAAECVAIERSAQFVTEVILYLFPVIHIGVKLVS
jgi:hypothetical protein